MTLVEVMRRNGIIRPGEVIELAGAAGLDLAAACVLLVKESGGGRNVWGSDDVRVAPNTYRKGGEVTRENYAAYRRAVLDGLAGRQGCGPTQLTASDFQDGADRAGGCWDWRANVAFGFRLLAGYVARYGERDAFVAYNGGTGALSRSRSHPAQLYGDDAVRKLAAWRALLPAPQEEDMPITDDEIEKIARRAAELVWQRPTRNAFGDIVWAEQILTGIEVRASDVQAVVRKPIPVTVSGGGSVDLDALAARVVELLAYKLAGGK